MINSGSLTSSQAPQVISGLTGMPSYIFLLAGLERVFAITLQIALSLLVLKGFLVDKKALYLTAAIVLHGLANFLALVATRLGTSLTPGSPLGGSLVAEGFLLVVAVLSAVYIARRAKEWRMGL